MADTQVQKCTRKSTLLKDRLAAVLVTLSTVLLCIRQNLLIGMGEWVGHSERQVIFSVNEWMYGRRNSCKMMMCGNHKGYLEGKQRTISIVLHTVYD